jgi:Zn finger protein HypA/HybF involved in hydrogenase expression
MKSTRRSGRIPFALLIWGITPVFHIEYLKNQNSENAIIGFFAIICSIVSIFLSIKGLLPGTNTNNCPKCNSEVNKSDNYCRKCGIELSQIKNDLKTKLIKFQRIYSAFKYSTILFAVLIICSFISYLLKPNMFLSMDYRVWDTFVFIYCIFYILYFRVKYKCPNCNKFPGGSWNRKYCIKCGASLSDKEIGKN